MAEPSVSIILPAYNEEEAIGTTLQKMLELKLHEKYEIIVVDDGSGDRTSEIAGGFPVRLYRHHSNKGYGASLKTGIRKATGDYVILMDSDGQHDPKYIHEIETRLENADMVIGERSHTSFQVKRRKAGKRLIKRIGEYLVEQKLPDYNSGFRGFHRETISGMLHLMPNGFSFSTTSTLAYLKEGYNIDTFPIEVSERIGRKSNVKMVKDGSKTILLLFRIIMLFNPLKVFFPASIISFLLGLGFGIAGYLFFDRFSNGAVVLTMLGMFLFFIGLVADQISILNRRKL
ncbi:MAG: glycosyltransferase family 2 protein [Bacteroidales bacterium]